MKILLKDSILILSVFHRDPYPVDPGSMEEEKIQPLNVASFLFIIEEYEISHTGHIFH